MDLGHGFIPRVTGSNYRALARALAPRNLFDPVQLELPWVWLDGAWAAGRIEFLDELRRHRVRYVLDTQAWRFQGTSTFETKKYVHLAHAPARPWGQMSRDEFGAYVVADLRYQAELGADAYLAPGLIPGRSDADPAPYDAIVHDAVVSVVMERPRPVISFIGVHSQNLDLGRQRVLELPHFYDATYVQVTPVDPYHDSADKLSAVVEFLLDTQRTGRPVIAGRLGALTLLLRSLGLSGADAGMGADESFRLTEKLRPRPATDEKGQRGAGPSGSRRYVAQIRRSMTPAVLDRVDRVPQAQALTTCEGCCRLYAPDDRLARGREHSLVARLIEAMDITALPTTMRNDFAERRWVSAQHTLTAVNRALVDAGEDRIGPEYLENHLAMFRTLIARRAAVA